MLPIDVQLYAVRTFSGCDPANFDPQLAGKKIAAEIHRQENVTVGAVTITSHNRNDEIAWPEFLFYATVDLAGEAVTVAGAGNGCGILEVGRSGPMVYGRVSELLTGHYSADYRQPMV